MALSPGSAVHRMPPPTVFVQWDFLSDRVFILLCFASVLYFDLFFLLKFAFERIVLCPRSPGALLLWSSPLNFDGAVEVSLLGLQVIVIFAIWRRVACGCLSRGLLLVRWHSWSHAAFVAWRRLLSLSCFARGHAHFSALLLVLGVFYLFGRGLPSSFLLGLSNHAPRQVH